MSKIDLFEQPVLQSISCCVILILCFNAPIGQLSCWRFPLEISRWCSLISGLNISGWSGLYELPAWLQPTKLRLPVLAACQKAWREPVWCEVGTPSAPTQGTAGGRWSSEMYPWRIRIQDNPFVEKSWEFIWRWFRHSVLTTELVIIAAEPSNHTQSSHHI